jgi:hypothetical protein
VWIFKHALFHQCTLVVLATLPVQVEMSKVRWGWKTVIPDAYVVEGFRLLLWNIVVVVNGPGEALD